MPSNPPSPPASYSRAYRFTGKLGDRLCLYKAKCYLQEERWDNSAPTWRGRVEILDMTGMGNGRLLWVVPRLAGKTKVGAMRFRSIDEGWTKLAEVARIEAVARFGAAQDASLVPIKTF